MGAEAWLPTPATKKDLGDGNYEVTLKALKPLELVPHGVAEGMKHSDETTFMVREAEGTRNKPLPHATGWEHGWVVGMRPLDPLDWCEWAESSQRDCYYYYH